MFPPQSGYNVFMPDISANTRIAQFITGDQKTDLKVRADKGVFRSHAEAEAAAKKLADAPDTDAVITQDEQGFHLYAVDEISSLLPGGNLSGEVVREAPIVSFVATDPLNGNENVIGQQAEAPSTDPRPQDLPPTVLDRYVQRYSKEVDKVLGPNKDAEIAELNDMIRSLEAHGMKISIEMDDDVFEYKDKFEGFKNMLTYAHQNFEALQQRSIREIAIVDEWDGIFGTKVDLEYDKKEGLRRLEIGDDFLNDWGESHQIDDHTSIKKLTNELGDTLSDSEIEQRTEIFQDIRQNLTGTYDGLNHLQQASLQGKPLDREATYAAMSESLDHLDKEVMPHAEKVFKDFSIKHERKLSQHYLETFKDTVDSLRDQLKELKDHSGEMSDLEFNGRLEKLKLLLIKGTREIPDSRNYVGAYVAGMNDAAGPSAGVEYARTLGSNRNTIASLRAGTSAPLKTQGGNHNDIMLGMGVSHQFSSRNKWLDGAQVGVGVGFSRDTPFMIGASASNSWYLNDYHGLPGEWSAVGTVHATVGTYNNLGAMLNVHKEVTDRVDFEGYGELSLWNQAAEVEGEFALDKNKDFYLTAGVGTNKLVYAGIGFHDKYELEVGLGGVSFGKDSNNLPGESGWEVGVRMFPLPMPYFRNYRVPGYQFTYNDQSREFITPNGTFMTIKDEDDQKLRQAYVPDPNASLKQNQIVYRMVHSKEELEHLEDAPSREISVGPLGYLTVVENGEKIIDDGLIKKQLTEADLGIITDQAGVLWFDRMQADKDKVAMGVRRSEMPLPLYRAVHY